MGIDPTDVENQTYIEYVKHNPQALAAAQARLENGDAQALFLLNPTRVDEVTSVVAAGERMPQKSTFFYPKVYTGITMRMLDDTEDLP